ncbi:hypothetical protein C900_01527 [Fulvivirga imtechensis AK7]|uniref:Uncharacterized protein n=1 Tax=Fulvivirga imtechensis AK7 TaxID=1237149 RepID=L8JXT4_9BACT|nr:hypothetical protein C900_01527 [Fulvivirga imtechensis AK7]
MIGNRFFTREPLSSREEIQRWVWESEELEDRSGKYVFDVCLQLEA